MLATLLLVLVCTQAPGSPAAPAMASAPARIGVLRKSGADPLFHVLDHWSRWMLERLRIASSPADFPAVLNAGIALLLVDGNATADLSEAERAAVLDWVRGGGKLAVFSLQPTSPPWPAATLTYRLTTSSDDLEFAADDQPLTRSFAGTVIPSRGSQCAPLMAPGWRSLARCGEGDAVAVRTEGNGEIAVLQLPIEITSAHEMMVRLASGLLQWIGERAPSIDPACQLIEAEDLSGNWIRAGQYHDLGSGVARLNDSASQGPLTIHLPAAARARQLWVRAFEGHGVVRGVLSAVGGHGYPVTHRGTRGERFNWWLAGVVPADPQPEPHELLLSLEDNASLELVDALLIARDGFDPIAFSDALRALPRWNAEEDRALAEVRARVAARAVANVDASTWPARAHALQDQLWRALGVRPAAARTPPASHMLGEVDRGDHVLERVVIETEPGVRVPANVFRPRGTGPWPAVLIAVGHWAKSKADPSLQSLAVDLARAGMLALIPEPFGQGERDVPGSNHLYQGSLWTVGMTNRGVMVLDLVRALDYLEHRADVRRERLACTGSSAGGMDSWLLGALDQRLVASAPVAFVTTYDEFLATRSRHCPCAYLPDLAVEMDQGDVLALTAPRACLVVAGTRDPLFPITGTRAAVAAAHTVYRSLGAEHQLALFESDDVHALNQAMRERITGFFRAHLCDDASRTTIPERAVADLDSNDPALRCFAAAGESGKSLLDIANQRAEQLLHELPAPAEATSTPAETQRWRQRIRTALALPPIEAGVLHWQRDVRLGSDTVKVGIIEQRRGPALPIVAAGIGADAPVVILVAGCGKDLVWLGAARERLRANGLGVVACDLRGAGELRLPDFVAARNAVLTGSTYLGERLSDLSCVVRALAPLARHGLVLCALDLEGGVLAEICAALDPQPAAVVVCQPLLSFTSVLGRMNVPEPLFVPRVLASFDMPHVRALIAAPRLAASSSWEETAKWIASTLR